MLKLYTYFRSSAAYRVRIALALKGLDYESRFVHLVKDGGQQHAPAYLAANPQGLVPALQTAGGDVLAQSLAIIEYLEETHPDPPLLPPDAIGRARVRALANAIACDIHPLNNLRVLRFLKEGLGISKENSGKWYAHWVAQGLGALEASLAKNAAAGRFCHGDSPTLADCFLVPQIFNARRFGCPLDAYPTLVRIAQNCNELPAFQKAAPENQPDAE